MNESIQRDFNLQLDRLVDGELSGEEYRQLLAALDRSPDGWRRCGLAFLESQAMRGDLAGWMDESLMGHNSALVSQTIASQSPPLSPATAPFAQVPAAQVPAAQLSKPTSTSPWKPLVLAASVMLSFTLGAALSGMWNSNRGTSDLAKTDSTNSLPTSARQNSNGRVADTPPGAERIGASHPPKRAIRRDRALGDSLPAHLQLVVEGENGSTESISVPTSRLTSGNAQWLDPHWLARQPSGIPSELLRQLRHSGREVRRKIELVPVQAGNGQWFVVPVEEVDIAPAARKEMQ